MMSSHGYACMAVSMRWLTRAVDSSVHRAAGSGGAAMSGGVAPPQQAARCRAMSTTSQQLSACHVKRILLLLRAVLYATCLRYPHACLRKLYLQWSSDEHLHQLLVNVQAGRC